MKLLENHYSRDGECLRESVYEVLSVLQRARRRIAIIVESVVSDTCSWVSCLRNRMSGDVVVAMSLMKIKVRRTPFV